MQTRVVIEPAEEPVSLEEAKRHLGIEPDLTDSDVFFEGLLRAARLNLEKRLGRAFATQTLETIWVRDSPACTSELVLRMPRAPVQSFVSVIVGPVDATATILESDLYMAWSGTPGELLVSNFGPWRFQRCRLRIAVRYVAGYGNPTDVPEDAKLAIKMLAAHWYARREPVVTSAMTKIPFHIEALLDGLRWGNYPQ